MHSQPPNEVGRLRTEDQLIRHCRDFSASYMAVQYLGTHIQRFPDTITPRTLEALTTVVESQMFDRQKQVLFLYSEAADALVAMACHPQLPVAENIIPHLRALLSTSSDKRLRAIGQALGKLPVKFPNARQVPMTDTSPLPLGLEELVSLMGEYASPELAWQGRSLVIRTRKGPAGVIKFATSRANADELLREVRWMQTLHTDTACPDHTFEVPIPVTHSGRVLFRLTSALPCGGPGEIFQGICIAFIPCRGYYEYPNEMVNHRPVDQAKQIFFKNAMLLGALTARGIFHTALIPLFHNRTQQGRRNDNGAYLWEHGGRLDQWLDSCRFPNFAVSGPRDFEHLIQAEDSRQLRHYIGEHLLSFALVIGSYFRNRDPLRRGRDENFCPCDTRDLFDPALFRELLSGVSRFYFQGLVKTDFPCASEFALDRIVRELVDELVAAMGRDEDMEETLRARDQKEMDDNDFRRFLAQRGVTDIPAKGESDITLETGPHLGGFNRTISTPGLIDYLFRFSALCVSHCFTKENKLKA